MRDTTVRLNWRKGGTWMHLVRREKRFLYLSGGDQDGPGGKT